MDEIIAIVGKVLAAAVVALFAYLVPKIKTWLDAKIGSEGTAKVLLLIENFVTAADQLYKTSLKAQSRNVTKNTTNKKSPLLTR